mmetsp:Transcript_4078/g.4503  ORF Transcript_4078/g.4503 Transcript_4078/m.4503 type:complete len:191 (-) Transcript_4078:53-625(-)
MRVKVTDTSEYPPPIEPPRYRAPWGAVRPMMMPPRSDFYGARPYNPMMGMHGGYMHDMMSGGAGGMPGVGVHSMHGHPGGMYGMPHGGGGGGGYFDQSHMPRANGAMDYQWDPEQTQKSERSSKRSSSRERDGDRKSKKAKKSKKSSRKRSPDRSSSREVKRERSKRRERRRSRSYSDDENDRSSKRFKQ